MLGASYHITRVLGIPIKAHITLLIFLPILALNISSVTGIGSLFWGLLAALGLFASVALHELGHAVVALSKRIRVREILLLPIGGLAQLERMPERPADEFQIAIAGPIVSLFLAFFFGLLYFLFAVVLPAPLVMMVQVLASINLMLALFNLLPSFPMDGGRIFRAWLSPRIGHVAATRIAARTGRSLAILFGIWGLLRFDLFIIAIAIFIYMAAGAEYRMVVAQHRMRQRTPFFFDEPEVRPPVEEDPPIVVGPPPYARSGTDRMNDWWTHTQRKLGKLFDDLFKDWK
jgi:Zn-dependent protease